MQRAFKLAVALGRPVSDVLEMPWWEFNGFVEYFAKVGYPQDRIESYLIKLLQQYMNTHLPKNASPKQFEECALFKRNPWATEEDEARDVFASIAKALQ